METEQAMQPAGGTARLQGLSQVAGRYDLLLCDVWGVLHNGVATFPGTIRALSRYRQLGGKVVFITNAPRRRKSVYAQLAGLGVPDSAFDRIVTSGDVTRRLIADGPSRVYHLGPPKDLNLFEDLPVTLVSEEEAEVVVCSGLWDDRTETPDDYASQLERLAARKLDFICANPDIVVEVGNTLIYCAGALAEAYRKLGGNTLIAGKPHAPIYDVAIAEAEEIAGRRIDRARMLAIGDGLPTDIRGAIDYGLDVLFISSGIHAGEYGGADDPDDAALAAFLAANGLQPSAYMPGLDW